MKEYDKVKLIVDNQKYMKENVIKDMIGTICQPEIRDLSFLVCFEDEKLIDGYACVNIKIEDLQVVHESLTTDETLLEELPLNNKDWWCKVEDGYIMNLKGEKKNKIPYDYNS
ncbi:MAG: hypothetical protein MJ149_02525 [Clostridia bacterium]|nr:hypothetical protein [Clostridia bacterium]